jgi:hypothetical protein
MGLQIIIFSEIFKLRNANGACFYSPVDPSLNNNDDMNVKVNEGRRWGKGKSDGGGYD